VVVAAKDRWCTVYIWIFARRSSTASCLRMYNFGVVSAREKYEDSQVDWWLVTYKISNNGSKVKDWRTIVCLILLEWPKNMETETVLCIISAGKWNWGLIIWSDNKKNRVLWIWKYTKIQNWVEDNYRIENWNFFGLYFLYFFKLHFQKMCLHTLC
jgi:hypothetical protein